MHCLIEHHTMKTYGRSGSIAPRITNLDTRWRWVVSFILQPLYRGNKALRTQWIGSRVSPRAGLDAVANRKIPCLYRGSKVGLPAPSTATILPELPWLLGSWAFKRNCTKCNRSTHVRWTGKEKTVVVAYFTYYRTFHMEKLVKTTDN